MNLDKFTVTGFDQVTHEKFEHTVEGIEIKHDGFNVRLLADEHGRIYLEPPHAHPLKLASFNGSQLILRRQGNL